MGCVAVWQRGGGTCRFNDPRFHSFTVLPATLPPPPHTHDHPTLTRPPPSYTRLAHPSPLRPPPSELRLGAYAGRVPSRIVCLSSVTHHFADPVVQAAHSYGGKDGGDEGDEWTVGSKSGGESGDKGGGKGGGTGGAAVKGGDSGGGGTSKGNDLHPNRSPYHDSKLYMLLLAVELNRFDRSFGDHLVRSIAVDPGAVRSDIWRGTPAWLMPVFDLAMRALFLSTSEGASTSLAAAVAPLDSLFLPRGEEAVEAVGGKGEEGVCLACLGSCRCPLTPAAAACAAAATSTPYLIPYTTQCGIGPFHFTATLPWEYLGPWARPFGFVIAKPRLPTAPLLASKNLWRESILLVERADPAAGGPDADTVAEFPSAFPYADLEGGAIANSVRRSYDFASKRWINTAAGPLRKTSMN